MECEVKLISDEFKDIYGEEMEEYLRSFPFKCQVLIEE